MEGSSYFLRADRETGSAGLFLSFLSHCHGGSFLENALCFLSFLSLCHWGYISENAVWENTACKSSIRTQAVYAGEKGAHR